MTKGNWDYLRLRIVVSTVKRDGVLIPQQIARVMVIAMEMDLMMVIEIVGKKQPPFLDLGLVVIEIRSLLLVNLSPILLAKWQCKQ